jgi:hypothetical protein
MKATERAGLAERTNRAHDAKDSASTDQEPRQRGFIIGTCTAAPGRVWLNLLRCSLEDPNVAPIIGRTCAIFEFQKRIGRKHDRDNNAGRWSIAA